MDRPSSTSSSERAGSGPSWGLAWLLAVLLCAGALFALDGHWRARGHQPHPVDSMALWAMQRERAYQREPEAMLLLGASRIQAAIDMKHLRGLAPEYRPLMLAVNGTYPMAVLRDLARDEQFRGVVVIDIEANGLLEMFFDLQQPQVDYYRRSYTPSWRLHRTALTRLQRITVLADPRFSGVATLRHLWNGTEPFLNYAQFRADRGTDIDFQSTDSAAVREHFRRGIEDTVAAWQGLRPDPQAWLEQLAPVFEWAQRIEDRGGRVIFYQSPLSGGHVEVWDQVYPPSEYWDRFVAASPFPVLDGRRIERLSRFELPDESHLDFRDKVAFTEAWWAELQARGLPR